MSSFYRIARLAQPPAPRWRVWDVRYPEQTVEIGIGPEAWALVARNGGSHMAEAVWSVLCEAERQLEAKIRQLDEL